MRQKPLSSAIRSGLLAFTITAMPATQALATNVVFETPLGDIRVKLFDEETPITVGNFLNYVVNDLYTDAIIHRSVSDGITVIQGGGYAFRDGVFFDVLTGLPIPNEPGISNKRGTIAMAKMPGDPDSATSQWFFNVTDNSAILDDQNGGFTVFGEVIGDGMVVVDAISEVMVWTGPGVFSDIPLIEYPGSGPLSPDNMVYTDIRILDEFVVNAGLNDAWFNPATPGQGFFITVFPNSGKVFLAWFTFDTERPAETDGTEGGTLGDPGARWLTAFGDFENGTAILDIELTQGGIFDSPTPVPTQSLDGTITLEFSDCENGMVNYDIPSIDRQGEIPIQRIALDNVARCEELAAAE